MTLAADLPPASLAPPDSERVLEEYLSRPSPGVAATLGALEGDILLLGAGGKLGLSLARMARRGLDLAGKRGTRVIAVSRFAAKGARRPFEEVGVDTLTGDLLAEGVLEHLPSVPNVVYLAGMKFGASADPATTWALNTHLPGLVARRFRGPGARLVALSTGNVYGLVDVRSGGSLETDAPRPAGEYAQSCLGRERVLAHYAALDGTRVALVRLNYAVDLRYGVAVDLAQRVGRGEPVDLQMGSVNMIWQGDANRAILQSFALCASPPAVLNVSGPETLAVRWLAARLAELLRAPPPPFAGAEAETAILSNCARQHRLFGYPEVSVGLLLEWVAAWQRGGGRVLGKPTEFARRDGAF